MRTLESVIKFKRIGSDSWTTVVPETLDANEIKSLSSEALDLYFQVDMLHCVRIPHFTPAKSYEISGDFIILKTSKGEMRHKFSDFTEESADSWVKETLGRLSSDIAMQSEKSKATGSFLLRLKRLFGRFSVWKTL